MWTDLVGWVVIGAAVTTLIGAGVGVMSMAPPDFNVAKGCFSIAALILLARLGWWIAREHPEEMNNVRVTIAAFLLFGLIGALWTGAIHWVNKRQVAAAARKRIEEETAAATAVIARELVLTNRPWLLIVKEEIDHETGRIDLTIENRGGTPAYQVHAEHWAEISKVLVGEVRSLRPGEDIEDLKREARTFKKEYDTRENYPQHGGRRSSMSLPMVGKGDWFEYSLSDDTPEFIKSLKIEGHRQIRFVGEIMYTDVSGEQKPPIGFCYGVTVMRFTDIGTRRFLHHCLDQDKDMNVSR